ncbi:MAG TPA: branched-chain amino acid ABC transporter permease [Chloroflexota bacterium]|nr:branched-chain amino acid ABC transporter permease [Chloroflexota bacterium]
MVAALVFPWQGPELTLQILLIGIANGAIVALIALGYTLVYGIIELINFAHGDVFMIGTMVSLTVITAVPAMLGLGRASQLDPPLIGLLIVLALIASILVCALLNAAIERFAYRHLRNAPRLAPLISAIGVSFILVNLGLFWKGASPVDFPNLIPNIDVVRDILGINSLVTFTIKDFFVIAISVPLTYSLHLFITRTRLGKAMRATAQDREAAALMGIDINQTIALTFLIGGALAGAAGLIFGLYNNTAWFFQGFRGGLMAFTAAVLGGIGNITGAVLGGFIIGLIAARSDFVFDARWTQAVVFAILILILVFRPTGLLGEETAERA